jgi:hypothetical protein
MDLLYPRQRRQEQASESIVANRAATRTTAPTSGLGRVVRPRIGVRLHLVIAAPGVSEPRLPAGAVRVSRTGGDGALHAIPGQGPLRTPPGATGLSGQ